MQFLCSRVGALVYTIRTKPCRWSIDLMTTTDTQENLQKNSWSSSFSSLTPSTSCKLRHCAELQFRKNIFSSSTGSCLHIGTYRFLECKTFCDLNCLELFSWWFRNNNLHDFVHETAATLFWETYEKKLWFFFLFNFVMFWRSWACTSQTCIMCWSWILAWRWSSHYNL